MSLALAHSGLAITVWVVLALIVVAIVAAAIGHLLVKRGRRQPYIVRLINRASGNLVDSIKKPITVAMLDEVAEVLRAGNYTRNIAAALAENRDELKQMVAEKIKEDPVGGRINLVPFHDRLIELTSETALRVIFEILDDPRTDELVADLLRDNLTQIRQAIDEGL